MASKSVSALEEKVNRLLSRTNGKPILKPNKPLVLKDEVANRKMRRGGKISDKMRKKEKKTFRKDNVSEYHNDWLMVKFPLSLCDLRQVLG